ncbi:hypothetical protein J7E70_30805 [Variovorax paradoxus]|nr:hypothetical protein [Variovorax paradoxus]MBT2304812.1 hypothetical protein [Variovorax paradoxus]
MGELLEKRVQVVRADFWVSASAEIQPDSCELSPRPAVPFGLRSSQSWVEDHVTFFQSAFGLLSLVAVCGTLTACDGKAQQAAAMDEIYRQVVDDTVTQYNMVKRQGGPIDICVHAGLVAAAYLQAKDEPGYATWKDRQKADCETAGMPSQ